MRPRPLLLAAAAAGLLAIAAASAGAALPALPGCVRLSVPVGHSRAEAELCRAPAPGAAVVVLHGCGGFSTFDRRLATELPRAGISTLYLDYFGLTPPPGRRGFCGAHDAVRRAFPVWLETVHAAAETLRSASGVDARRIGLVGWSMGGGLALASAGSSSGYSAVAAFSVGAFGAETVGGLLPPTLLLSGGVHDAIPLSATERLYSALRRSGTPVALFVYPNGTHQWAGRQGSAGIAAAERFLDRHLGVKPA